MFKKYNDKYPPYETEFDNRELDKLADMTEASVFARISETDTKQRSAVSVDSPYSESVQPSLVYVKNRSPFKTVFPIAATAAVLAIAVPIGMNTFGGMGNIPNTGNSGNSVNSPDSSVTQQIEQSTDEISAPSATMSAIPSSKLPQDTFDPSDYTERPLPELSEVAKMTDTEATVVIKGFSMEELDAAWGSPNAELPKEDSFIWHYQGREITVMLDGDGKAKSVRIGEPSDAGQHTDPNKPVPPTLEEMAFMSYDEMVQALKGFTVDEIFAAWGEPATGFDDLETGERGYIWYFGETKHIIVICDDKDTICGVKPYEVRD